MIKDWLAEYNPRNKDEAQSALREIMQEVALAGLYRGGFFEKAAFYGGTALRIFHGLDRFSEDLDFSLLQPEPDFSLDKYLDAVQTEFQALGMQVSVKEKKKAKDTHVDSAFLKSETIWRELVLEGIIPQSGLQQQASIKIKIEVDTMPPVGFETEEKLLLRPFSFYVKCFTLPNLFAGKLHALLFRKWRENVKGRDWYDFEWYIKKGIAMDLEHFLERAQGSGDLPDNTVTEQQLRTLLTDRIHSVDMEKVKADAVRFIPDGTRLAIWSQKYFDDLAEHLRVR
ncbi:nucleotidyl transferase AbiEii/AbiGii toxin family protein [Dawidia soli]|uniref:Nucleotidyl transferase AbiEii/AbiGii toxin family protein n=1 Tax=Dawidia soli TaxID=2782352 RepID=A0AAP2GGM3_9BACT|nr:nucleotidyl transferase AbiEii/AbiGii toxin family protein [Dawidia soli]MBT1690757.1 nucleotidyl transferase AbiEii/AbiGii toxin family protein [Dawidia soli]